MAHVPHPSTQLSVVFKQGLSREAATFKQGDCLICRETREEELKRMAQPTLMVKVINWLKLLFLLPLLAITILIDRCLTKNPLLPYPRDARELRKRPELLFRILQRSKVIPADALMVAVDATGGAMDTEPDKQMTVTRATVRFKQPRDGKEQQSGGVCEDDDCAATTATPPSVGGRPTRPLNIEVGVLQPHCSWTVPRRPKCAAHADPSLPLRSVEPPL